MLHENRIPGVWSEASAWTYQSCGTVMHSRLELVIPYSIFTTNATIRSINQSQAHHDIICLPSSPVVVCSYESDLEIYLPKPINGPVEIWGAAGDLR